MMTGNSEPCDLWMDGVGKREFVEFARLVFGESAVFHSDVDATGIGGDFGDDADVAIPDVLVVVVPGLDDFVARTVDRSKALDLELHLAGRVECVLK